MKRHIWTVFLTLVAAVSGLIVLSGYFTRTTYWFGLRSILLNWFAIVASFALAAGGLRLLKSNWKRLRKNEADSLNVWIMALSLTGSAAGVLVFGQASQAAKWILNYLIVPVEASLLAVLAIFLIYGLIRLLLRRQTPFTLVFALTVVLMLALHVSALWINIPWIKLAEDWMVAAWSIGAIRAVLIGVALGGLATGLRVLMGTDRPYES